MLKYLMYWVLERFNNKPLTPADLFIPKDELEEITWALIILLENGVRDLDFKDLDPSMVLYVKSFEELFYHIEILTIYSSQERDTGEEEYPNIEHELSLSDLFYSCKREYAGIQDVIKILFTKWNEYREALGRLRNSESQYQIKRAGRLIRDVTTIVAHLKDRDNVI